MENTQDKILVRIAKLLMLHSSFVGNLGLMNGKMGVALFFYHLSRYTDKKIYDDFAGELIDEIYAEIHNHYPSDFKNGLCGIAWGIEYLIQNHFVEADANDVLCDLDKMILEWDVRRISDLTLESGLEGIAYYVIARCTGKPAGNIAIPGDYISELCTALEKNGSERIAATLKNVVASECSRMKDTVLTDLIHKTKYTRRNLFNESRPLGISNNGYAGIGLHLILKEK